MIHFKEDLTLLFSAIMELETGSEPNPTYAVGSSKEIGPFQITYEYFIDSGVSGTWTENCLYVDRSIKVMIGYWNRYARQHTWEEYARIHNGGPYGMADPNTVDYWDKVLNLIEKQRQSELKLEYK